jgi:hypothetical protein
MIEKRSNVSNGRGMPLPISMNVGLLRLVALQNLPFRTRQLRGHQQRRREIGPAEDIGAAEWWATLQRALPALHCPLSTLPD